MPLRSSLSSSSVATRGWSDAGLSAGGTARMLWLIDGSRMDAVAGDLEWRCRRRMCENEKMSSRWEVSVGGAVGKLSPAARNSAEGGRPPQGGMPPPARTSAAPA